MFGRKPHRWFAADGDETGTLVWGMDSRCDGVDATLWLLSRRRVNGEFGYELRKPGDRTPRDVQVKFRAGSVDEAKRLTAARAHKFFEKHCGR